MKITILCGIVLPSEIVKKNYIEHYKFADEYLSKSIDLYTNFSDIEIAYIKKFNRRPYNTLWIHKCANKLYLIRKDLLFAPLFT